MSLDELREEIHARPAQVRARGMDAQHHPEAVGLLVDGEEALVAQQMRAVGGEHAAHVTELRHRAAQLGRRRHGILHGEEGH